VFEKGSHAIGLSVSGPVAVDHLNLLFGGAATSMTGGE